MIWTLTSIALIIGITCGYGLGRWVGYLRGYSDGVAALGVSDAIAENIGNTLDDYPRG